MNVTEKREAPPQKLYELVKCLSFKDDKIKLAGSAGLKAQQYASDYDFNTNIADPPQPKQMWEEFKQILKRIEYSDSIYFVELKLERTDGTKEKFYKPEDLTEKAFMAFYNLSTIAFIKIDVVWRFKNEFMEASCIYTVGLTEEDENPAEYRKRLMQDLNDFLDEGKSYKALKRLFSILKEDGEEHGDLLVKMTNYFNTEIGALYQFNSQLKALELLPKDKGTIRRINVFLKDHQIHNKYSEGRIKRLIKKNDAIINKSGNIFLKNI
jgi:hypothetical protein